MGGLNCRVSLYLQFDFQLIAPFVLHYYPWNLTRVRFISPAVHLLSCTRLRGQITVAKKEIAALINLICARDQ